MFTHNKYSFGIYTPKINTLRYNSLTTKNTKPINSPKIEPKKLTKNELYDIKMQIQQHKYDNLQKNKTITKFKTCQSCN